ncbi:MAG: hypothetical protein FJZ47_05265 [Candidatus Tectomicrobia bacterium]|uniref:Uncharacterized protein n=1 Tax=Tectimicrobiota bacterium TaxID=2528274 RepID=A0A938B1L0_UNCTE|nr:hypothetical protein [Candidatus Tectomicrobia bacterium]
MAHVRGRLEAHCVSHTPVTGILAYAGSQRHAASQRGITLDAGMRWHERQCRLLVMDGRNRHLGVYAFASPAPLWETASSRHVQCETVTGPESLALAGVRRPPAVFARG